jgi:hypothetical protein
MADWHYFLLAAHPFPSHSSDDDIRAHELPGHQWPAEEPAGGPAEYECRSGERAPWAIIGGAASRAMGEPHGWRPGATSVALSKQLPHASLALLLAGPADPPAGGFMFRE